MRITGRDGTTVTLQPRGYEFPSQAWEQRHDAWLIIHGHVAHNDHVWAFTDACLRLDEAGRLGDWLGRAAAGSIRPAPLPDPTGDGGWPSGIAFIEPVVGFSLGADQHGLVLRVHFGREGAPPWLPDDDKPFPKGYLLDLHVDPRELHRAAKRWAHELDALPDLAPTDPNSG
jgi:hypothetical protein